MTTSGSTHRPAPAPPREPDAEDRDALRIAELTREREQIRAGDRDGGHARLRALVEKAEVRRFPREHPAAELKPLFPQPLERLADRAAMRFAPLLLLAVTGCQGAGMTVPKTAAPVLLGPVDRVGGHRAEKVGDAKYVHASTGTFFDVLTCGPYISMSRFDSGVVPVTTSLLEATGARDDADVHVTTVATKSTGLVLCGVLFDERVSLRGSVVAVKR